MAYEIIKVNELYDGRVTEIVLGPGPGNIVAAGLMDEVSSELDRHAKPECKGKKLIVFRGEGNHFSYGASVEEHRADRVGEMLPRFHGLIRKMLECPVPTLAHVSGLCLGGGFELALACSMIFCSEDAKFGVPEIQLGVFPPAAAVLLQFKTTDSAACEMVFTGGSCSAEDMHRLGIVNRVAENGALDGEVCRFIEKKILPKSASSLRLACRAVRGAIRRHYEDRIDAVEKLYLDTLMSTTDAVEGIEAFLEKRPPHWVDG